MEINFSAKNSKKFVYYNKELVHKFKFQTQLSRKLQRFRTCRKNKKCFIFHDLSEYIIFSYDCNLLDWSFKLTISLAAQCLVKSFKHIPSNQTIAVKLMQISKYSGETEAEKLKNLKKEITNF